MTTKYYQKNNSKILLTSNMKKKYKCIFCGRFQFISPAVSVNIKDSVNHFAKATYACNGFWLFPANHVTQLPAVFVCERLALGCFLFTLDLFPSLLVLSVCLWNIVPVGGSRHFIMNKMYYHVVEGENMKYS